MSSLWRLVENVEASRHAKRILCDSMPQEYRKTQAVGSRLGMDTSHSFVSHFPQYLSSLLYISNSRSRTQSSWLVAAAGFIHHEFVQSSSKVIMLVAIITPYETGFHSLTMHWV